MHWIDWAIMIVPLFIVLAMALYSGRYVRGVSDFLAAGRVAGRYVMSVGDLMSGLSVINLIALCEAKYQTGYGVEFWGYIFAPVSLVFSLTGFCVYRWRETKALSFGQFLEMRYNRAFRIFASALRTISEMITNALGPAIAVNFFIYFLNLPRHFTVCGLQIPVYAFILAVLMTAALICIWPGGRVSLLITDTIQGLACYPVFLIIIGYILVNISWFGEITPTMADRVAGESFLNPYDLDKLRDFNLFMLVVNILNSLLNRASWFGNDTTNVGRTPHEQKMAGILGAWRNGMSYLMVLVLAVLMITVMNHQHFAVQAKEIRDQLAVKAAEETIPDPAVRAKVTAAVHALPEQRHKIGVDQPLSRVKNLDTPVFETVQKSVGSDGEGSFTFQKFRTIYQQQMVSVMLSRTFPKGVIGLFGLLMILLVLSTDDSRIFNASSTIIQDVILPFCKKPLSPRMHLLCLRLCSVAVGVFFLVFSLTFVQLDYINMFTTIMCSIWLGGAGPVMLGGLYTRFGTTAGAFSAVLTGAVISVGGIVMQNHWAQSIYPFLVAQGWAVPVGRALEWCSSPFNPYIVWEMTPEKFPINSFEIFFIAMVASCFAYAAGSLLTIQRGGYNLDRLLHRGIYSIDGEKKITSAWTWRNFKDKLIGITPEYTRGDKIITWAVFLYSFGYNIGIMFLFVVIWNIIQPWPSEWWGYYFFVTSLVVPGIVGLITTVWFTWGGTRDILQLFRDLEKRIDNPLDNGCVVGEVSLADEAAMAEVEKKQSGADKK